MTLDQHHLHDRSTAKAAREALANAKQLFLSGYFKPALQITSRMTEPGPWEVQPHTDIGAQLAWTHSVFCWACESGFPGFGLEPAIPLSDLKTDLEANAQSQLQFLVMSDHFQRHAAGRDWDEVYFSKLVAMQPIEGVYRHYGEFSSELDVVLRQRLRNALDLDLPTLHELLGIELPDGEESMPDFLVADQADRHSTEFLIDVLGQCVDRYPHGLDYMARRCFIVAAALALVEQEFALAVARLERSLAGEGPEDILALIAWPPLFELIRSGGLRPFHRLSNDEVERYLEAFHSRSVMPTKTARPKSTPDRDLIDLDGVRKILASSPLADVQICQLDIPECNDTAIAIRTTSGRLLTDWQHMRELLPQTRRWPIVTIGWSQSHGNWEQSLQDENLFMREPFQSEHYDGQRLAVSPQELVTAATEVDLADALEALDGRHETSFEDELDYTLGQLQHNYGQAPSQGEVMAILGDDSDTTQLATYLHQWLLQAGLELKPDTGHLDWFKPGETDHCTLLLLPTAHGYEAPAYLHWYGAESMGTEVVIAMLKRWQQNHGAELVCHYGTMLQLQVQQRPSTIDLAIELAREQELLAPCTTVLPGVTLLDHALALMATNRWFLHERP